MAKQLVQLSKRLERELGSNDRKKLDEYIGGVRDIERRIERLEDLEKLERQEGALPDFGQSASMGISEHIQLMHELIGLFNL